MSLFFANFPVQNNTNCPLIRHFCFVLIAHVCALSMNRRRNYQSIFIWHSVFAFILDEHTLHQRLPILYSLEMLNFLNTVRRSDKGHVGSNIVGKSIVSLKRKTSFYINLYFSSFHSAHPPLSFC